MASGAFGFNTGNGDMYAFDWDSMLKDGQPHTITAVFVQDDRNACKLYVDGVYI